MPCIRVRHHFGNVVLDSNGSPQRSSIYENHITTISRDGDRFLMPFGGFVHSPLPDIPKPQMVKLLDVMQVTYDELGITGWSDIPKNHYCVGVYGRGKLYLVLRNNQPIIFPLSDRKHTKLTDNVIAITSVRK